MKIVLLFLSLLLLNNIVISQKIGINTKNPQKTLDINGDLLIRDKLYVKNGLNSSLGEAVLVSGLAQVFTKKITKKSVVFFLHNLYQIFPLPFRLFLHHVLMLHLI